MRIGVFITIIVDVHHDIHKDDMEFFLKEDMSGKKEEDGDVKYKLYDPINAYQ